MWAVTIGVLISALFCASHSETEEPKHCEQSTLVRKTLGDFTQLQRDAIKNAINLKELPSLETVVYSFDKIVNKRRKAEGGLKEHIVLYIAAEPEIFGYFNFNGREWGFNPITEERYNNYAKWCGIEWRKPRK